MFFNFGQGSSNTPFTRIDAEKLQQMIASQHPPFLLDVREPFELAAFGAIPGVVNIPMREVTARMDELPQTKDAPIVVICQSGNRSQSVARSLAKQGYAKVYNLEGGTMGYVHRQRH